VDYHEEDSVKAEAEYAVEPDPASMRSSPSFREWDEAHDVALVTYFLLPILKRVAMIEETESNERYATKHKGRVRMCSRAYDPFGAEGALLPALSKAGQACSPRPGR